MKLMKKLFILLYPAVACIGSPAYAQSGYTYSLPIIFGNDSSTELMVINSVTISGNASIKASIGTIAPGSETMFVADGLQPNNQYTVSVTVTDYETGQSCDYYVSIDNENGYNPALGTPSDGNHNRCYATGGTGSVRLSMR